MKYLHFDKDVTPDIVWNDRSKEMGLLFMAMLDEKVDLEMLVRGSDLEVVVPIWDHVATWISAI